MRGVVPRLCLRLFECVRSAHPKAHDVVLCPTFLFVRSHVALSRINQTACHALGGPLEGQRGTKSTRHDMPRHGTSGS
jgi:hypothetical protein